MEERRTPAAARRRRLRPRAMNDGKRGVVAVVRVWKCDSAAGGTETVVGNDANVGEPYGRDYRRHLRAPVGSGRGNDAATAAGAVAGAAVGSGYGGTTYSRDVQRCARSEAAGPPQYWDVTYRYRGMERYVQMTRAPGPTITVNREGEPRAQ